MKRVACARDIKNAPREGVPGKALATKDAGAGRVPDSRLPTTHNVQYKRVTRQCVQADSSLYDVPR